MLSSHEGIVLILLEAAANEEKPPFFATFGISGMLLTCIPTEMSTNMKKLEALRCVRSRLRRPAVLQCLLSLRTQIAPCCSVRNLFKGFGV